MTSTGAIIGRDGELGILTSLIARCPDGGQAMVLIGDPGIGKSALLGAAGDVARAAGISGAHRDRGGIRGTVAVRGLHQLFRRSCAGPTGSGPLYRDALHGSVGLAEGPSPIRSDRPGGRAPAGPGRHRPASGGPSR